MAHIFRLLGGSAFSSLFLLLPIIPASAANVLAQGPCSYFDGGCMSFSNGTNPIPVVRSFTFNMPAAGKALVRFDGTMQCAADASGDDETVIDLSSQIVQFASSVPTYTGPGGNRYAMRLPVNSVAYGKSAAVNLAASRMVNFTTGGNKAVFFKFNPLRMDLLTSCVVFAAAFTVETFP